MFLFDAYSFVICVCVITYILPLVQNSGSRAMDADRKLQVVDAITSGGVNSECTQ